MITRDMRYYDFFTIGGVDAYGQATIPNKDAQPVGKIKIAINVASQAIQDNILYINCSYVGLTHAPIDDTYVINYNGDLLKVLYVNPKGRYKQVFLAGID